MAKKLSDEVYEEALERMQLELVDLQEAVRHEGLRMAVVVEGRDTAGKGGTIARITARLNPRGYDVVALGSPPSASMASGTSSATSRAYPRPARSPSSIAAGTTAPGWSG